MQLSLNRCRPAIRSDPQALYDGVYCARGEMENRILRRVGLKGTELARAQVTTLRIKLLKMGAVVQRDTRRMRFQ